MPQGGTNRPIIVGVDGSDFSKTALAWAVEQARLSDTRIQAVITWAFPANLSFAPALPDMDFQGDAKKVLAETVAEVCGEHPAVEIDQHVSEGHAALVLTDLSAEASLVVVGTRGHGSFVGMLLGSVSYHVVAHAHCPVLVAHAPTES
jgi:nucleotide-binding universal stress UspA family protein